MGSPFLARVEPSGVVAPARAGWRLDWWIGAEDRWHLAGQERAVRQDLVDGSPVLETWMRIPSGDAVARTWAVPGDGGPLVVLEVENASPVPVAVALVLLPGGIGGGADAGPHEVELVGREVRVDGEVALVLLKEPNRAIGSVDGAADLEAKVTAGDAVVAPLERVVSPEGEAAIALVVPLPHTARVRVVVPLGGARVRAELADAASVARGWAAQADRGARVDLPDPRLGQAIAAARRQLLLWAQASGDLPFADAASVAATLARWGLGDEALAVLAEVTERSEAARRLSRRSKDAQARAAWVDAVERVADAVGEVALAEGLGGAPKGTAAVGPRQPRGDLRDVLQRLTSASPTWAWSGEEDGDADPAMTASFLDLVADALVQEVEGGLRLLPHVPTSWLGQGVEVHDLPTPHGSLSLAVRWHGERPALLWDLVAEGPAAGVQLELPGLDPSWSTTDAKGEALLAAPVTSEQPGAADAAPPLDPGASFS